MTNEDKINNYVPEFIRKPTATISYFNESEWHKNLTPEQKEQQELINASYQTEQEAQLPGYGPCSYSGCPHSTDFEIEIFIEGNRRKWARRPNQATWLPGSWEYGTFTSHYLSRWDLWLKDVDQANRVMPLLSDDTVYAVNLFGAHCAEDVKFCNAARDIIRECINCHQNWGQEIKKRETLPSEISRWSRTAWKVGAGIAAVPVLGPGGAMAAGATAWGAGQVGQELCDSERGKSFWGTVGGMGGSAFQSGLLDFGLGAASSSLASQGTRLVGHEAAREIAINGGAITNRASSLIYTGKVVSFGQKVYKIYDAYDTYGQPIVDSSKHQEHMLRGINYQSDCKICN